MLPTQLFKVHVTGNTHVPPPPPAHWFWLVHVAPPMLQVPAPQSRSWLQLPLLFEHRPPQSLLAKQVAVLPAQTPGKHWLDWHDWLPVHD
jgi:hypothetical protein